MVQMKVTASILLAAAAIAPVVAYGFEAEDSLATRENNEFESAFARDFDLELEERELDDDLLEREFEEELFERARGGGGNGGNGGNGRSFSGGRGRKAISEASSETREFNDDILEREFDEELYERARGGGGGGRSFSGGRSMGRIGLAGGSRGFRKAAPEASSETREFNDDVVEREFDEELFERARGGGGGGRSSSGGRGMGRMMKFGGGGGGRGIRKGLGRVASAAAETTSETREFDDDLLEREDEAELFGRDVDLELFEREPEPFLGFGFLKKLWKGKKTPPVEDAAPDARSVDEMELLEREYYDELD